MALVVPKPSISSKASSIDAAFCWITCAARPIDALASRSVPSPSPGRP
jgi:hypothetical protein